MRRSLLLFSFLLVVALTLTGCIEIEYNIDILEDGKEKVAVNVKMPNSPLVYSQTKEITEKLESSGYSVSTNTVDEKFIITGSKIIQSGKLEFPYPSNITDEASFEPTYTNLLFIKFYGIKSNFTFNDKVKEVLNNMDIQVPLKYNITLPGKISKFNSNDVNGNKLTWSYIIAPGKNVNIEASSYLLNYAAIVIFILIIVFIGFYFYKKDKESYVRKTVITSVVLVFSSVVFTSFVYPNYQAYNQKAEEVKLARAKEQSEQKQKERQQPEQDEKQQVQKPKEKMVEFKKIPKFEIDLNKLKELKKAMDSGIGIPTSLNDYLNGIRRKTFGNDASFFERELMVQINIRKNANSEEIIDIVGDVPNGGGSSLIQTNLNNGEVVGYIFYKDRILICSTSGYESVESLPEDIKKCVLEWEN